MNKALIRRELGNCVDALGNTRGRPFSALLARFLTWVKGKLQ